MGKDSAVRRLDLGYFIRPASETGTGQPRVEPVLAYLVRREDQLILFDTGIGAADPGTEATTALGDVPSKALSRRPESASRTSPSS